MKILILAMLLGVILTGCATVAPPATSQPTEPVVPTPTPTPTTSPVAKDIWNFTPLGPIEPGRYFVDPDLDPSTSLRVEYDVAADGWRQWIGGFKPSDAGHVGLSITTVVNLVSDGCQGSWADPPIGSSIDDLVAALSELAPFEVTSAATDVTIHGYSGRHLVWTVPELPVTGAGGSSRFTGCAGGQLKSWVAPFDTAEPGDAFYGYTGPGYAEEFWILDVEGTRLMIAAETSAGSPAQDIAERDAILDSIRIEP